MTREQLESYKSKKAEIQELQYRRTHLGEDDSMVGNDIIFDYRTGYPIPQAVVGDDREKMYRLYSIYRERIDVLTAECEEVELWIENISDSVTRRIFRMYFVDGMKQKVIGKVLHLDRSSISKKIDTFLKVSHNSHNSHV